MAHKCTTSISFLLLSVTMITADSDTRSVEAEFERCETTMERTRRELVRFEEVMQRVKRSLDNTTLDSTQSAVRDVFKLTNRIEYLRSRIDRSNGQRDRIRNDLRNVKGPSCPSCLSSSVDLYCRNGENLAGEIDDCLSQATVLEDRLHGLQSPHDDQPESFPDRYKKIEQKLSEKNGVFESCGSAAGTALWEQSRINLGRADSLYREGEKNQSLEALDLVELLVKKALKKCGGK